MTVHKILWRRFDPPGFDICSLHFARTGLRLEGTAAFVHRGMPCRLDYAVSTDSLGRTRRADIRGPAIDLTIRADRERRWTINGRECPAVKGCEDADLSFTPATNTLPIRRLGLPVGGRARVRAAWLRFPDFTLHPLDQAYFRKARLRYEYATSAGFRAALAVNPAGLVTRYGRLWRSIS